MSRSRNWMFTLFPDYESLDPCTNPDMNQVRYMVWQNELCPTTQRSHLQGYVNFHNPKGMSSVKAYLGHSVHVEPRKGTHQQAVDYCTKEDTRLVGTSPEEFGDPPEQGHRSDLDSVCKMVQDGLKEYEIAEHSPTTYVKFHKGLRQLANVKPPKRDAPPEVTVLIGPPGCGKTRYVFDREEDLWCSPIGSSKWYDGYERHEAVLFDDFYGGISYADMLRILDRYPYRVEVKGGFVWWCPKRIYITSNDPPDSWWGCQDLTAFNRRVTSIIDLDPESQPIDVSPPA